MELYQEVQEYIKENANSKKAAFDKKIIKTQLNIYGVQTALLRKKAKEVSKLDFYCLDKHESYEMEFIFSVGLAYAKIPLEDKLNYYIDFMKKVDNWAIVDGVASSLKLKESDYKIIYKFAKKFHKSKHEFLARFCYILLLNGYVKKAYAKDIIALIYEDAAYYILMGEAWLLATLYIDAKEEVLMCMESLDKNKELIKFTLRKIYDSFRIDKEEKLALKNKFKMEK